MVMEFESGSSYGRRPDGKDTVRSGLVNSSCIATLETPHHVSCLLMLRFTDRSSVCPTIGLEAVVSDVKISVQRMMVLNFCLTVAITMMARTDASTMEMTRQPQHWMLKLIRVVPVCCILMTSPAVAFTSSPFVARQHVSENASTRNGRHLMRPQRSNNPRNRQSNLFMAVRQMVRT